MTDLILSSSAIKTYKDCPKAFELGYVKMLEPVRTTAATESGTLFHQVISCAAKRTVFEGDADDPMFQVAADYLEYKGLPRDIVSVEEPIYVKLDKHTQIRCTFDLVYRVGADIVIRDYKTFEKAPNLDLDLDFQGRMYIAAARKYWPVAANIVFEYEYVRRSLYHEKGGLPDYSNPWTPAERYLTFPLVISHREMESIWAETKEVVRDIRSKISRKGIWYRADKKGFNGCPSCFYKDLCKAENQLGYLDDQTIALYAKKEKR